MEKINHYAYLACASIIIYDAGVEKINFSGGEPFIKEDGHYVGELVRYSKRELQLPSVSIVSNGSLITEQWFEDYGEICISQ